MLRRNSVSLLHNLVGLSGVQIANFILPWVIYPYLARVLELEKLGLVFFSMALCNYFVQFADYGFSNTAVRKISQCQSNRDDLEMIASTILLARLFLATLGFFILIVLLLSIEGLRKNWELLVLTYSVVFGQALFPYWFFQGMEAMNYHALINLISKITFGLFIFCLVRTPGDYYLVNLYQGIAVVIAGVIGWLMLVIKFKYRFVLISTQQVLRELKEGFPYFISNFSLSLGSNFILVLLEFSAGSAAAGVYGLAEKIVQAFRAGAIVVYQATLPKVSYLATISIAEVRLFVRSVSTWTLPFFILGSMLIWFLSDTIIVLFTGHPYPEAVTALRILSLAPVVAVVAIPPSQILVINAFYKSYAQAACLAAFIGVILASVIIPIYGIAGAAYSFLFFELFSMISFYSFIELRHPAYSIFKPGR